MLHSLFFISNLLQILEVFVWESISLISLIYYLKFYNWTFNTDDTWLTRYCHHLCGLIELQIVFKFKLNGTLNANKANEEGKQI